MERVLVIGDSQCGQLGSTFFADTVQRTNMERYRWTDAPGKIHVDFDCLGYRRVDRCWRDSTVVCTAGAIARRSPGAGCCTDSGFPSVACSEAGPCTKAVDVLGAACQAAQPASAVVLFLGVNDMKSSSWLDAGYVAAWEDIWLRAIDTAVACPSFTTILMVSPLPLVPAKLRGIAAIEWGNDNRSAVTQHTMARAVAGRGGTDATWNMSANLCRSPTSAKSYHLRFVPTADLAWPQECGDGAHYVGGGFTQAGLSARLASELSYGLCLSTLSRVLGPHKAATSCLQAMTETMTRSANRSDDAAPPPPSFCGNNLSAIGRGAPVAPAEWDSNLPNAQCNATASSNNTKDTTTTTTTTTATVANSSSVTAACAARSAPMLVAVVAATAAPLLAWEFLVIMVLRVVPAAAATTAAAAATTAAAAAATAAAAASMAPAPVVTAAPKSGGNAVGAASRARSGRIHGLDGVRVLAAAHIATFHIYQQIRITHDAASDAALSDAALSDAALNGAGAPPPSGGGVPFASSFAGFGKYMVVVFFCLSGFLLADTRAPPPAQQQTARSADTLRFVATRLLPLLPLHLVSLILAVIVQQQQHAALGGVAFSAQKVALSVLLLQSWGPPFHYADMNGPSWFLSNLAFFYCCFPRWHRFAARLTARNCALALLACWLASFTPTLVCYALFDLPLYRRWYGIHVHSFIAFSPLANWPSFAVGVLFAHCTQHARRYAAAAAAAAAATRPETDDGGECECEWRSVLTAVAWFGAPAAVLCALLFFSLARAPGFEMGTYLLLLDKGPLTLPPLLLLIAGCLDLGVCKHAPPWPWGDRLLVPFAPAAHLAWPLYILHVPLSALIDQLVPRAAASAADPFLLLWVKPILLLVGAMLGARLVDAPVRAALKTVGSGRFLLPVRRSS